MGKNSSLSEFRCQGPTNINLNMNSMMAQRAPNFPGLPRRPEDGMQRNQGFRPPPPIPAGSISTHGAPRFPGGPSPRQPPPHALGNMRREQKVIKKEDIPRQANVAKKEVKQVEVECVAPYDEQKWVNIGKEKDGMKPQDVQYAQALKPPYHLASFLKMAGNSSKGISATDKNTMVFVVLGGEVTVVLNTSQFEVRKGDSFFVPPHNTYNILNLKPREAELFLVQYKYEGSLVKTET